ncbi:methylmalonyl-CoA epimerase [Leptolinea sp. HRD-7]|jgi:methylmalonyl-CoA/ethylmalonyl-CoA epimerase|nr:methylmalonyl-CoA epimerase [Leptolinea sp. HRD-7]
MAKIIRINHIGIAVADNDVSLNFWSEALNLHVDHVEEVIAQKSQVTFIPVGESEIELVKALSEDSTIAKFITERGPGIHHICLETDNIYDMLAQLKEKGIRLINETPLEEPGRLMAFIHPKSTGGVLVELYQVI